MNPTQPARHALVVGASSGIGATVALALATDGFVVSIAGRRIEALNTVRDSLGGHAGAVVLMDVTDASSVTSAVSTVVASHGPVDVLVNSAGRAVTAPAHKTTADIMLDMWSVNVMGAQRLHLALLPSMIARGSGRIIHVASVAGLQGFAYASAYASAKHALIGLVRSVALEIAQTGVTINAVCPGYTDTPLIDAAVENIVARTGRTPDDVRRSFIANNPMQRFMTTDEVAHTVSWLASPGASAIHGQAIVVAGGEVMPG